MPPKKPSTTRAQKNKMRQSESSDSDPMDTDSPPPSNAKGDGSAGGTHRYRTRQSTSKAKPKNPTIDDPMDEDSEESTPTNTPSRPPKKAKPASPTDSDPMDEDTEDSDSTPTTTRAPRESSSAVHTPSRYPIRSKALTSSSPAKSEPCKSKLRRPSGLRAQTEVPQYDSEEDAPYDCDDDQIPTPIPENMDDGVKIDDSDLDNTYDPEDEPQDDADGDSDTIVVDVTSKIGRRPPPQPGFSIPKFRHVSVKRQGHSQRSQLPRLPTGQKRLPGGKRLPGPMPLPPLMPTLGRPAHPVPPVSSGISSSSPPFDLRSIAPRASRNVLGPSFNPQSVIPQAIENVDHALWPGAGSSCTTADVYFRISIGEYHFNLPRKALELVSLTGQCDIGITAMLKCEDPNEPGKHLYLDVIHACRGDNQASWEPKPPSGAAHKFHTLRGWINTFVSSES